MQALSGGAGGGRWGGVRQIPGIWVPSLGSACYSAMPLCDTTLGWAVGGGAVPASWLDFFKMG